MKLIVRKNELDKYEEVLLKTIGQTFGVEEANGVISSFKEEIGKGIKAGAIKVKLNKSLDVVMEYEEGYVIGLFDLYAKYLAVVIPQIKSIIELSKNLYEDSYKLFESFDSDEDK